MTEAEKDLAAADKELSDFVKQASTPPKDEVKSSSHLAAWTPELVCKLSLGIGAFAILSFALVAFLIWQKKNAEQILRTFGILVIIFAAVFLVVAGYSDTQITPVIGLLGTIAGYLLGRKIEPGNHSERHQPPAP
jgi:steroid 5-alpha reductase family enzyme